MAQIYGGIGDSKPNPLRVENTIILQVHHNSWVVSIFNLSKIYKKLKNFLSLFDWKKQ